MCRMRETNNGSVPAECFGPSVARRVRPLLRLQNHVAGQVFLEGSEAILQRGFLQVSLQSLLLTTFASCRVLRRGLKRRKNRSLFEFGEFGEGWWRSNTNDTSRSIIIFALTYSCSRSSSFRKEKAGKRTLSFSPFSIQIFDPKHFIRIHFKSMLRLWFKPNTRESINYYIYIYIHWRARYRG